MSSGQLLGVARAGLILQPFPASAGRWVGWSFRLRWLRPEGSCRGGAPAGSPMIVESPTGMPSEDSTKAGSPILWVPAADRYAVNARFVAAGSGAVPRCERRLPGFAAFAGPTYPSPEIGLTRCSQPPRHSRHFPDIQGSPPSRPWTPGALWYRKNDPEVPPVLGQDRPAPASLQRKPTRRPSLRPVGHYERFVPRDPCRALARGPRPAWPEAPGPPGQRPPARLARGPRPAWPEAPGPPGQRPPARIS